MFYKYHTKFYFNSLYAFQSVASAAIYTNV